MKYSFKYLVERYIQIIHVDKIITLDSKGKLSRKKYTGEGGYLNRKDSKHVNS